MRVILKLVEFFILLLATLLLLFLSFFLILQKMEKKPAMVHFIESFLTDAFGIPTTIEKVHFSFPFTVSLEKLKIENSLSKNCPLLFESTAIQLKNGFSPFSHGIFFDVFLMDPKTSFELHQGRHLLLPLIEEGSNGEELPSLFSGKLAASLPIRNILIRNGMIKIFSGYQTPLFILQGIEEQESIDLKKQKASCSGRALLAYINSVPLLHNVHFNYIFFHKVFQHLDLDALLAGGKLHLSLSNSTNNQDREKKLQWKIISSGSKIEELFSLFDPHGSYSIFGSLSCKADGFINKVELNAIEGNGTFQIEQGKIKNLALFQELSELLKNTNLNSPEFEKWYGSFKIKEGKIFLSDMAILSNSFSMTGNGFLRFDSSIDMDLKILLNKTFFNGKLPDALLNKLNIHSNALSSIPVKISGTLANPKAAFIQPNPLPRLSPSGSSLLSPPLIFTK